MQELHQQACRIRCMVNHLKYLATLKVWDSTCQMALPPEPMPIGRPTAVVGGPAYFTPAGYQAPPQPTEAFMPTDVRPDPIGQQFMRQYESPMGKQFIDQYEATQAPIRAAEAAARAEEQAAQDARFQEMMDRIAELEGQLATPTEPIPDVPIPTDPYIPDQTPFPGIPDFIKDLDFRGLPNFDIDYDDIMRQDNDRETRDVMERIEAPSNIPPARIMPMPVGDPKPIYTPPPMVPNTPKIPTIPNIDFSNLPKFDLPTTGGRPMIPDFGNINLR